LSYDSNFSPAIGGKPTAAGGGESKEKGTGGKNISAIFRSMARKNRAARSA